VAILISFALAAVTRTCFDRSGQYKKGTGWVEGVVGIQLMPVIIRPADLHTDRKMLINMLFTHLTKLSDDRRFDWLYRDNPHGCARVWIATDTETHTIIGSGAAIPHRLYAAGVEKTGCLLADFWIHPQYRSLGPAVQLQRCFVEYVNSGSVAFFYDLPQSSMAAVYRRLSLTPGETLLRLAKPLRVDRYVAKAIKFPLIASCLNYVGNEFLKLRDRVFNGRSGCAVSLHQGAFNGEFSDLSRRIGFAYGASVVRSADYLNWRYRSHYHLNYETVIARRRERLEAYAVFADMGDYVEIVDMLTIDEVGVLRDLIGGLLELLRERGSLTLNIALLPSNPWLKLLQAMGFVIRESRPIVVYDPSKNVARNVAGESGWYLTYGDLDH
jgi:hypothetical protein